MRSVLAAALSLWIGGMALQVSSQSLAAERTPPNVVVILADDKD
jgi:hypothetical protein